MDFIMWHFYASQTPHDASWRQPCNEITFSTTRREERDLIGPSMVVRTTLHETIGWSTSRRGDAFTIRLTTVDRVHVGWQTGRLIRGGDFRKKIKKWNESHNNLPISG